jgi:hypothetical protein
MTDTADAELIARAHIYINDDGPTFIYRCLFGEAMVRDMRDRLTALAEENERLKAELRVVYKLPLAMDHPVAQQLTARAEAAEARVRELEKALEEPNDVVREAIARADAIEAETIERCLNIAINAAGYNSAIEAIRALGKA